MKYDLEKVTEVSKKFSILINESKLTNIEAVLTLCALLRAVGENFFDGDDFDHETVRKTYLEHPTFAAAVILTADLPMELLAMFAKDKDNPEEAQETWLNEGPALVNEVLGISEDES